MAAREPLTWEENIVAAFGGAGIACGMIGGAIAAFDSENNDIATLFVFGGVILIGIAVAIWMMLLQPWKKFDDLKTPYFTGHHHDKDHDDEHHMEAVVALPPSEAAPIEAGVVTREAAVSPPASPVQVVHVDEPTSAKIEVKPQPIAKAEPDDLKIIEGVGPKVEEALHTAGITTFAQVAAYTPQQLEHIVKVEQKVRIVGSTATWVRQAKYLAAGDLTALDDLKKRIKSGYLYDEFTIIKGIGPEIEQVLYEAKIRSYNDLAGTNAEELQKLLKKTKIVANYVESWPKQAQFILDDDPTGLEEYQNQLG